MYSKVWPQLSFFLLCLGCACNILPSTPAKQQITFVAKPDFECWTRPAEHLITGDDFTQAFLLVSEGIPVNGLSLYRIDPVTGESRRLVTDFDDEYSSSSSFQVSPQGKYFLYQKYDQDLHTSLAYIFDITKEKTQHIPQIPLYAASWSADGSCVISWLENQALAYRVADGALQQKIFPGIEAFENDVKISPNGHLVAWTCSRVGRICIMDWKNQEFEEINLEAQDLSDYYTQERGYLLMDLPRWSPDGRTFAFAYNDPYTYPGFLTMLRLVDFSTSSLTQYKDISMPIFSQIIWSPDSNYLLILADKTIIYEPKTGDTRIVPVSDGCTRAAWSPSSKHIACIMSGAKNLLVFNIKDIGNGKLIPFSGNLRNVFWVPLAK